MKMTEESQKPTLSLITICKTVQMESKQSTSFWVVPVENSYKEKYLSCFPALDVPNRNSHSIFTELSSAFPAILW